MNPDYGYVPRPNWFVAHKGLTVLIAVGGITLGVIGAKAAAGNSGPPTYLATGSSQVALIQWSGSGTISGTLTDESTSGTPPSATINSQRFPFTGMINGSSVSLQFSELFATSTIFGNLNGGTLTLNFPQNNGTIEPSTFVSSDLGAFNADVAALQRRINHANAAAQIAQEQQQQQAQNAQDQQTAQNDIATLQQDTGNFSGDLSALAGDVKQTNKDLAAERQDAARGPNADGGGCYNLEGNVDYDVQSNVDYDIQSNLDYDLNNLTSDIHTVHQDMAAAQADLQTIASYGGTPPPGASSAIAAAHAAIRQAKATANGYIDQANADDAAAYAVANGIATGSCSGQGPGSPPAPVPHIH